MVLSNQAKRQANKKPQSKAYTTNDSSYSIRTYTTKKRDSYANNRHAIGIELNTQTQLVP